MVFTVADICNEMSDMARLIEQRQQGHAPEQIPDFEKKMVRGIQNKIISLQRLDASEAMRLGSQVMLFSTEQQEALHKIIDDKLMSSQEDLVAASPAPTAVKPQLHIYMHYWLIASQWEVIENPKVPYHQKVRCLCEALRNWGVQSLHEQTVKWSIALLTAVMAEQSTEFPKYKVIFEAVKDFKAAFASTPAVPGRRAFHEFPADPSSLGDAYMQAVYSGELPVPKDPTRLTQIANFHIPLRSSSKLLKKEAETMQAKSTPSASEGGMLIQALLQALNQGGSSNDSAAAGASSRQPRLRMSPASSRGSSPRSFHPSPSPEENSQPALQDGTDSPMDSSVGKQTLALELPGYHGFMPKMHRGNDTAPAGAPAEPAAHAPLAELTAAAPGTVPETPQESKPRIDTEAYEKAAYDALMAGATRANKKAAAKAKAKAKAADAAKAEAAAAAPRRVTGKKSKCAAAAAARLGAAMKRPAGVGNSSAAEDGKSSTAGSSAAGDGNSSAAQQLELPNGWGMCVVVRPDGASDKYYHPPDHGSKRLRSKTEVAAWCQNKKIKSPFEDK